MSGFTSTPPICEHCGYGHVGTCPKVKAIEYHPNGTVKRIEFHEQRAIEVQSWPPVVGNDLNWPQSS